MEKHKEKLCEGMLYGLLMPGQANGESWGQGIWKRVSNSTSVNVYQNTKSDLVNASNSTLRAVTKGACYELEVSAAQALLP